MLNRPLISREVVLVGGGHAHALFLRKWGMKPIPGVQISLISPNSETTYTGMLPGFLAGHYSKEQIAIDLVKLCRFAGARFIMASVDNILSKENLISISGRDFLPYDVASINIGVTSALIGNKLSNLYTNSIRPLTDFVERWSAFKKELKGHRVHPKIVIIGGGIGAVEIAMAMSHAIKSLGITDFTITLLDKSELLNEVHASTRKTILTTLKRSSILTLTHVRVFECTERSVRLENGSEIESNFTIIAAGARAYDWLEHTDLSLKGGFIKVDQNLRVLGRSNIFAVGDCAHLTFSPRPKAGVFAVRQAPILFQNVCAKILKRKLKVFSPQRNHLKLISLGDKKAISDYVLPPVSGGMVWNIKNKIDQAFMIKFSNFPLMTGKSAGYKVPVEILNDANPDQMLCGGCGAKVSSEVLNSVIQNIDQKDRKDVLTGIGDDAAVIDVKTKRQILTTDHLREFNSDLWSYAKITAVHSLGDIWAMGGKPQVAMAHIIIPEASDKVQKNWLKQIMRAASDVFEDDGARIVGGHTSIGAEFSIGFSVTGTVSKDPILISGARPGDLLVLTKPIGSGTILAGEMQLLSRGHWVESALKWMTKSQRKASEVLSSARAMTDITGFGLAGHLIRICEHSQVSATIEVSQIPFLVGAEQLAKSGIRSSLYENNLKVKNKMAFVPSAKANLLFDPQTSGGLLAAIPKEDLDRISQKLTVLGFCSNVIGRISKGKPFIFVN